MRTVIVRARAALGTLSPWRVRPILSEGASDSIGLDHFPEVLMRTQRGHVVLIALALSLGAQLGCGGGRSPISPSTVDGRISDLQAARDIIQYNQSAQSGGSFRDRTVISRWELPVPVVVDSSIAAENVRQALEYWATRAGITFNVVNIEPPRSFFRAGTDGLGTVAIGRALVDATFPNNRIRSTLTVIHPDYASCEFASTETCAQLYLHEVGHALGFLDHLVGVGLMAASGPGRREATAREVNMMRELYRLPHGARVQSDGTWQVVK
jgi:hypothetical protein